MTYAHARGLATLTHNGTVLDVWYPAVHLEETAPEGTTSGTTRLDSTPQQFAELAGPDEERGVARVAVNTVIADLDAAPADAYDAYLRLHLLSHRVVRPHTLNVDDICSRLANVVWTNYGPCAVADFQMIRGRLSSRGPVVVYSVDKFPRMVDYVIPSDVTISDADRVRLGAYLAPGTTVTHEGFVNINAGTLGPSLVEGRVSAGVVVGKDCHVGEGSSLMGTICGSTLMSMGHRCQVGANTVIGISLGEDCLVTPGISVTPGTDVIARAAVAQALGVSDGDTVEADRLDCSAGLVLRRNPLSGAVEATSNGDAEFRLGA